MDPAPSHLDQIAVLLAEAPPRDVPPELRRAAMRQTAPLLFIVIGGILTAFTMIFFLAFFPWSLTRQWKLDASSAATTPGKVLTVERTSLSISKSVVMRTTFEYSPSPTSGALRGSCYTTGSSWSPGADVVVRYRPDDPSIACVAGARLTKTGPMAGFVVLLPGIGLTMIWIGLRLRHNTLRLLVHGQVTEAHVTAVERTVTQIGNDHVYHIRLKRIDRPDDPPLELNKWDPTVVAFARARLDSQQPVFVLFDPRRPKRALLPEVL
jgi:hypothetical protein